MKVKDPDTIQIMKDFMANGRFSRGVEIIADASMAFIGNLDLSVNQLVNSSENDLFQPLPKEFDLAVMDRLAMYMPGWEMPKTSSDFLTSNYGFITDYLAEAFHYQLKHTSRYEDVARRIKFGTAVEGRDEKGIIKTVAAFLKMMHPHGEVSDEEFEEYVEYAVEGRRRVKEQMNKRKPDDEFEKIGLSYFASSGDERVVDCPESKGALATIEPEKPSGDTATTSIVKGSDIVSARAADEPAAEDQIVEPALEPLKEMHYTITYNATGFSYESIVAPYLRGAKSVVIEDPYIRATHQVHNFVRFCEAIVKTPNIERIQLITNYDEKTDVQELAERLAELKQSLLEQDVELDLKVNESMHDREIRIDNGWTVKIGRGLDFYQKPDSWFGIGANDLSLRKCLETKVDIYRA